MSINKVNPDGSLSRIAGRGSVEYGASTVRTGTATFTIPREDIVGTGHTTDEIVFDTPMPDTNYIVVLSDVSQGKYGNFKVDVHEGSKTKTGFKINYALVNDSSSRENTVTVAYVAFKLHSVEGLEELENDVAKLKNKYVVESMNARVAASALGLSFPARYKFEWFENNNRAYASGLIYTATSGVPTVRYTISSSDYRIVYNDGGTVAAYTDEIYAPGTFVCTPIE